MKVMRKGYLRILSLLIVSLLSSNVIAQTKLEENSKDLILSVAYSNVSNSADYTLFTDPSCSELRDGVSLCDINKMNSPLLRNIAEQLYNGTYDTKYRVEKYNAVPSPDIIAEELKIGSGFSRYENITGMFLRAGRSVVLVGNTHGQRISLRLPNLMRKPTSAKDNDWSLHDNVIELKEGVNFIDLKYDANAYVDYF